MDAFMSGPEKGPFPAACRALLPVQNNVKLHSSDVGKRTGEWK